MDADKCSRLQSMMGTSQKKKPDVLHMDWGPGTPQIKVVLRREGRAESAVEKPHVLKEEVSRLCQERKQMPSLRISEIS